MKEWEKMMAEAWGCDYVAIARTPYGFTSDGCPPGLRRKLRSKKRRAVQKRERELRRRSTGVELYHA